MSEPIKDIRLCPESAKDSSGFIPLRSRYIAGHQAAMLGITQAELRKRAHDARVPDDGLTAMQLRQLLDYRRERKFVLYRHMLQYLSGKLNRVIHDIGELTCSELRDALREVDQLPNICKKRGMRSRNLPHG